MESTESGFSKVVYLEAAQERITSANRLLSQETPDYVMATYLGGVAVECLFHAYRMRARVADTAKHDLLIHSELGNFYGGLKSKQRAAVNALVSEVVARWRNNHRYRSASALRAYIVNKRLHFIEG